MQLPSTSRWLVPLPATGRNACPRAYSPAFTYRPPPSRYIGPALHAGDEAVRALESFRF